MAKRAIITGVGHYAPPHIMTNHDIEKLVDTNDEWIVSRTGIRERRILDKELGTSYMGVEAIKMLMKDKDLDPKDIDAIIVATVTPDTIFPSTSCRIQEAIGAVNAFGVDLNAACSGFVYALMTGASYIETGRYKKVLVVGADKMSSILNFKDRATCVLFGDGAGVVLLEPGDDPDSGVLDCVLRSDGSGKDCLYMEAGGSLHPASHETVDKEMHFIYQDGRTVFKFAVTRMADVSAEILERNNISGSDLRYFIPHQANLRIIEAAAKRMKLEPEQVVVNIERYGNTTAGTIPLALSEVYYSGGLKKGDLLVFSAFGAGFTWGSALVRWAI
ncbi:MAG TPA: beta-ketoacyl-ACP synthase III [Calditrichia bacterium]|nr:ketoacyl-ACP synthase III [Calditrichota bacterium]HQU72054.1 beta-ketoacyl-ACP synthase III [Calditrichia bacterium]HQV30314.1 beta-ketoacyl-ACP synthase III [Calditrichia bacterium]